METIESLIYLKRQFSHAWPERELCWTENDKEFFSDIAVIYGHNKEVADMFVLCYSLCLN